LTITAEKIEEKVDQFVNMACRPLASGQKGVEKPKDVEEPPILETLHEQARILEVTLTRSLNQLNTAYDHIRKTHSIAAVDVRRRP